MRQLSLSRGHVGGLMGRSMQVQIDHLKSPPQHALTVADIKAIFAVLPEEWRDHLYVQTVRLSATLPEHSRFERPVTYSPSARRLTICSRGMTLEQARREVLRQLALHGLWLETRRSNRLSEEETRKLDSAIAPLLKELSAGSSGSV